jgi:hypothetical protein
MSDPHHQDEQAAMDELLRRTLRASPPPALSAGFGRRLARRLVRPRLSRARRSVLYVYSVVALVLSVWTLRAEAIDWSLTVAAIAAPLAILASVSFRRLRPAR